MDAQTMPLPTAKQKASARFRSILILLVSGLIGAVAGVFIGRSMKFHGAGHVAGWVLWLVPLELLLGIMLHEAGHVAAGLLCGFRFGFFIAGPIRIERENKKLNISFNRIPILWGGIAGCLPRSFGPALKRHMLIYTAGGPFFSLLGGLFLIPAYAFSRTYPNVSFLCLAFGAISPLLALATLIPMPMGGFVSDGLRIVMLLRSPTSGNRWVALGALGGLSLLQRPREWPEHLVEKLGDGHDQESDAVRACWLWQLWHMDRREYEPTRIWMERGLGKIELLPKSMRPALYLAAASFYARRDNDATKARWYFDLADSEPGLVKVKNAHTVKAAVLIAERRVPEARSELDLAAAEWQGKPDSVAAAIREDIEELRALIN